MKANFIILAYFISLSVAFGQEMQSNQAAGFPHLKFADTRVVPIKDTKNDRQYELYVELPAGYSENTDTNYPVIYYTDAIWHLEMLSGATEYMMEDAILVGISWQKDIAADLQNEVGAHVSRFRDYSIRESSNQEYQTKYQFGQAETHLDFIRSEVIPYVENNYRTQPENRSYFGYSLSGEFGAYILLTKPETFKNYILGSPSIRGEVETLSELSSLRANLSANVFISYGTFESRSGTHIDEFVTLLKDRKDQNLVVTHEVIEGTHQTAFPATAIRSVKWLAEKYQFPNFSGPYFGQKTPGMTAEIFAPGIVSVNGRYEYAVSFSPELDEIYFSGNEKGKAQLTYSSKLVDRKWTQPKRVNLTNGKKYNEFEAFVNSDNDKIFFAADGPEDVKVWYADRSGDSWGEAKELDSPINKDKVFYPNVAKNGDLFYFNISKFKMYRAPYKNGGYPEVHEVDIEYGGHGFISPEQDFMLVDAWKGNDRATNKDIHVCFKQKDGSWTKPINLGEGVNSDFTETCPSLTPDGKYLIFSRYNEEGGLSNIYWVDATVIDQVRPLDL